jgi:hypothetical protein
VFRVFAGLLLALITLFTNYTNVDLLGAASVDLPQQAGIPCIAAAVATAIEQQAQCNLVQLRHQLEPSERNARRVRDVISLLEEYGGLVG